MALLMRDQCKGECKIVATRDQIRGQYVNVEPFSAM